MKDSATIKRLPHETTKNKPTIFERRKKKKKKKKKKKSFCAAVRFLNPLKKKKKNDTWIEGTHKVLPINRYVFLTLSQQHVLLDR